MRLLTAAAAAAVSLAVGAGCGAAPPQPPAAQANRVASATAEIASACGQSYQLGGYAARPAQKAALEASAAKRALELARVYRAGAQWIYQGRTLTRVVAESVRYLRECGLPRAAETLVRLTR
jgi:hypothetical protein